MYFPDTYCYLTSSNVTFHWGLSFFSSPLIFPTLAIASPPPGFPPLEVIVDPLPSIPSPPLSPSPFLLLLVPQLSPSPPLQLQNPMSPSSTMTSPTPDVAFQSPPNDLYLPITFHKGTCTSARHHTSHSVHLDRCSPTFHVFILLVAFESIWWSHVETAQVSVWETRMNLKVEAFISQGTWTLVPHLVDKNKITWKWVFTLKCHHDSTIAHHKAHLITHRFTQAYGIDYTRCSPSPFISSFFACSSLNAIN